MRVVPTYFNGGPFDATIRMVPESDTFMVVGQEGAYEQDGLWGALRRFTWRAAQLRMHVAGEEGTDGD